MKKILLVLMFLCAFANAQVEAQPYYTQPEAQPVNAVSADQLPPGAVIVPQQNYVGSAPPSPYADSIAYYDNLAVMYASEVAMRSTGKALVTLGIIFLSVGVTELVLLSGSDGSGDGVSLAITAYAMSITGGIFLPIGLVKNHRYNRAVRNVNESQRKAMEFRAKSQQMGLYIKPEIDPINKALGARLAFSL